MKRLLSELRGAVMATLALAVVCCGIYPLIVFGISQALFHDKANGSLIVDPNGHIRGSELIGQQFTADKYFRPRPSAAGKGYDATASGGSNLGPTSTNLYVSIAQNISDYRAQNGLGTNEAVPADAVTASASGLDPDISPAAALYQVSRVARSRRIDPAQLRSLVRAHIQGRQWGLFGEPRVNVLELNLALDAHH